MERTSGSKYKFSIIIPMYNAEKYIANCLDSILNSDLPKGKYEVIIVNDGSEDNSTKIAQEYCEKNLNFTYFTQENQGQSVARNYGINKAKGEYIWFVDADDIVCSELGYIYEFLDRTKDIDVIKTKIKTFEEGQLVEYTQEDGSYTHKSGRDMLLSGYHPSSVCNMIVRKSLLIDNDLYFIPGITSQDTEFSHRLYAYATHIYTFKYITYLYLRNSASTTGSKDIKKVLKRELSNITISKSFYDFSQKIKNQDIELSSLFIKKSNNILLGLLHSMISKQRERKGTGINKKVLNEMKLQKVYPLRGNYNSFKKMLIVKLLNIEFLLKMII